MCSKHSSTNTIFFYINNSILSEMTETFETRKIIENRLKLIPAAIQPIPEQSSYKIKVFDMPVKVRTFDEMEQGPATIVTETRIERGNNGEKKYITSCFLNKVSTPVWYTESLLLDLEDKTKKTDVKVYYDDLYQPYRWEESFKTDLTTNKNNYITEVTVPINGESEGIHYISLENQEERDASRSEER